jgi:uncharacterized protein (DUF305 family)
MFMLRSWLLVCAIGLLLPAAMLAVSAAQRPIGHQHDNLPTGTAQEGICSIEPVATGFRPEMERGMAAMMRDMHAPGYSGNADIDFLAMMIPHHQGAIEMARLILTHGRDPLTRRLAAEVIASQQAEIEAMQSRLAILRSGPDPEPGGFPALGGTRG